VLHAALRRLAVALYVLGVLALFVVAGYWSFGRFVRRGVVAVPDVSARGEAEARQVLGAAGLRLQRAAEGARYDETVPPGELLRQSPSAGSLVKRGSLVEVVVSLGPELVEVPELRGKALQAAQVTLRGAGLTVGSTAAIFSIDGRPGTVVEQDPRAGSLASRSTPVRLFLCLEARAQKYLMPDLVYRDYEEVRGFFERRDVRLGSVKFERYEGIFPGVVLRQFPLAGHPLRHGDVISLVVAGGQTAEG